MPLKFWQTAENEWLDETGKYYLYQNDATGNVFAYRIHNDGQKVMIGGRYDLRAAMALADSDAAFARHFPKNPS